MRIKIKVIGWVIICFAFVLSSCTSNKSVIKKTGKSNPSMRIESNLIINSPTLNTSVRGDIEINNGDSLHIKINGPFGINVAELWADKNKAIIFNNMDGIAYVGTPSRENLEKAIMFSISVDSLIRQIREAIYTINPPHLISEKSKEKEIEQDVKNIRGYPVIKIKSKDESKIITIVPKKAFYEEVKFNIFPEIPEKMEVVNLNEIE